MIWIRPVRGTGWYCCGFPIPAGQKEKEKIMMNCTVTDDPYILIKFTIDSMDLWTWQWAEKSWQRPNQSTEIKNERWVMYLVYLWRVSTWPWEEGIHQPNSWGSLPSHRSHPDCWVALQTEEALEEQEKWIKRQKLHFYVFLTLWCFLYGQYLSQNIVTSTATPQNWHFSFAMFINRA